ncbi:hypothetical protein [Ilumatobacter sp.]|uniref:hypothetical protein n=1 Tax=Ilumatobacter sp. TaxID=1967498 RepID=UPI003B51E8EB
MLAVAAAVTLAWAAAAGVAAVADARPDGTMAGAGAASSGSATPGAGGGLVGRGFAGADPRRLPADVEQRWERDLGPSGPAAFVEVVGDRVVIARGAADDAESTVVTAVGLGTGAVLWEWTAAAPARQVDALAGGRGVLVVAVAGQLIGLDAATGRSRWTLLPDSGVVTSDVRLLAGTDFVAIPTPGGRAAVAPIDTGLIAGAFDGPTIGTDHAGSWFVRRGSEIVRYDLTGGWSPAEVVAADVDGDAVAAVTGGVVSSGPDGWASTIDSLMRPARPVAATTVGDVPTANALVSTADRSFVAAGPGVVVGASIEGAVVTAGWSRVGVLMSTHPTVRGSLVMVSSRGGRALTLHDGRTGDTVAALTLTPGALDSLQIVGNGLLTKRTSSTGARLAAVDLDGAEVWSLVDVDAVAVGDGVVVAVRRSSDGSLTVHALG